MKGTTVAIIILVLMLAPTALAHGSGDAYVRVVAANPDARTYTFRCIDEPATGQIRDWFIRPDNGIDGDEQNIAEFLDRPATQDLTFTFPGNEFYHIGCNIVYDNGTLIRGDLHIDLRPSNTWNPRITPVSGSGNTVTLRCDMNSGSLGSWQVLDARTHTITSLGTSREITYTAPAHGLYDFFCSGDGNRVPMPVEIISSSNPYFPNRYGVPVNGSTPPATCTPATEVCDQKDNDCDNQTDEGNVCGTAGTCYNSVQNIPATCDGGSITTDNTSGCRKLICTGGGSSMQVLACDKTGFFEMYKQTTVGSGIRKVCIGSTCIAENGYAKSSNYPICMGTNSTNTTCTPTTETCDQKDNDCDGQIDENDVCGTPPPSNQTCYNSVQNIPATCTGATISSDTWNGGRQITCGDLKVAAWDKSGFFEMYKQAGGSSVKICIGETCIKENGYAKSSSFPICTGNTTPPPSCTPTTEVCDGKDNDCDNQIDESNVCSTPPSNQTCYNTVNDIPASCAGGTITTDEKSGCRTLICENGTNKLQVMACNKPDGSPQYFEMYRQMQAGSGLNICIGETCINDAGYAKSGNYPLCT